MPFVSTIKDASLLDVSYVTREKLVPIPIVVYLFNQFKRTRLGQKYM